MFIENFFGWIDSTYSAVAPMIQDAFRYTGRIFLIFFPFIFLFSSISAINDAMYIPKDEKEDDNA